jgi:hypothetical protein
MLRPSAMTSIEVHAPLVRVFGLLAFLQACAAPIEEAPTPKLQPATSSAAKPPAHPLGAPVAFSWLEARKRAGGDQRVDAESLRGRVTVLVFVTTYDVASQAATRFAMQLARGHVPRLNVALVALEPLESRPLVDAFASALDLPFPALLADDATIRGEGPFAGLHHVPSFVVLDREGRERARHLGLVEHAELDALVRRVEDELGVARPSR